MSPTIVLPADAVDGSETAFAVLPAIAVLPAVALLPAVAGLPEIAVVTTVAVVTANAVLPADAVLTADAVGAVWRVRALPRSDGGPEGSLDLGERERSLRALAFRALLALHTSHV